MNLKYWIKNPKYIKNRIKLVTCRQIQKDLPWITLDSIKFLNTYLRSSDIGLEWGSGRSTIWFAKRVKAVISVESSKDWYEKVKAKLSDQNIRNVELHIVAQEPRTEYLKPCVNVPENSLDFILVDGHHRHLAAEISIPLLKRGGILIIDNINWFLTSPFRLAPDSVSKSSPEWSQVEKTLRDWRCYWTTDGVTDTAIWWKPFAD